MTILVLLRVLTVVRDNLAIQIKITKKNGPLGRENPPPQDGPCSHVLERIPIDVEGTSALFLDLATKSLAALCSC